ncbi:MAG TPA: hypothetical protein VGI58_01200 [Streptosporangiaceae bacterium]
MPVIALTLAMVLGGAGIAGAATGGAFILGRASAESTRATLSDSRGTPLSLAAGAGKAPLAVNRTAMVGDLNASYLGGLSSTSLRMTGGEGFFFDEGSTFVVAAQIVAGTGPLPAGTYYVTATANARLNAGDDELDCIIARNNDTGSPLATGDNSGGPTLQVAESALVSVANNGTIQEACLPGAPGQLLYAGITAMRVLSSSNFQPAVRRQAAARQTSAADRSPALGASSKESS